MNKNLFAAIIVSFVAGMVTLSIAKAMSSSKHDPAPVKITVQQKPVYKLDPCKRAKLFNACMGGVDAYKLNWASQVTMCSPKADKEALVDVTKTQICHE